MVLSDLPLLMMSKRGRVIYERACILFVLVLDIYILCLVLCILTSFYLVLCMDMYPCIVFRHLHVVFFICDYPFYDMSTFGMDMSIAMYLCLVMLFHICMC